MAEFLLLKAADEALNEVWQYSANQWGVEQAEAYIEGLFIQMQEAADRRLFWHSAKAKTGLDVFFVKYQKHYLFFRELDKNTIGIISIIHEQRNIVRVLRCDLDS